ncbi:hypothetical protein [Kingella oralis]
MEPLHLLRQPENQMARRRLISKALLGCIGLMMSRCRSILDFGFRFQAA